MMIWVCGNRDLMISQASMPFMRGIRTSSTTTSGRCSSTAAIALWPLSASPTTSMSGSEDSTRSSPRR
jgi:hypothetical protein